ncbi:MAG: hypothetical protein ACRENU_03135 [Gemmatimonadaceae bacterium]
MPAPNKVARKFNEAFGSDAGDAMVDWMNGVEEGTREVRADIAELRQEMNVRFAGINEGFARADAQFAALDARFTALDGKLAAGFAAQDAAAAKRHADFMKWTLGFWAVSLVTLVGAIATLSRMLP